MKKRTFYTLFVLISTLLFAVIASGFYIEENDTLLGIITVINIFINLEFMILLLVYFGWKWVENKTSMSLHSSLILVVLMGLLIVDLVLYITNPPTVFQFKSAFLMNYSLYHLIRTMLISFSLVHIAFLSYNKVIHNYLFHSTILIVSYFIITHLLLLIGLPTRDSVPFFLQALLTLGYFGGGFIAYMSVVIGVAISPSIGFQRHTLNNYSQEETNANIR